MINAFVDISCGRSRGGNHDLYAAIGVSGTPAASRVVRRWICSHQHPLGVQAHSLSDDVDLVGFEDDEAIVPRERFIPEAASVISDKSKPSLWTRPKTTRSPEEAMMDPGRMKTPASTTASPTVGANYHRGEHTDAMGWLEFWPTDTGGIRGGRTQ
jgi:hypothetical protein